ncbi:MAG: dihydroxyacetone kinase [Epulopiscium sp. Nele67-Bin002]|nr:MAG: dihydroxyacetone kinase [Epulopiscium sp. Nuni2H_MBin001]OON92639.1 MAG: dihydroxyacetone kinase [Epulopiscium sp. Nele67-Bin002]OON93058.1 MAG: dihydroxyacetone kinase [Epulopiscium sp. Nele67-Bin001]
MIVSGAMLLDDKKDFINELNVFPVPDGDTGTNMSLTMLAAAKEVEAVEAINIKVIGKAFASGSLRGARGNSGVILSQLIRGFVKGLDKEEVDTVTLAKASQLGVETAYKAVMKPKEGTILTVAREVANKASSICEEVTDIGEFIKQVIEYGYKILAKTQDMLPVLKEAGVVDAGGQGLMTIIEGAARVLLGEVEVNISKPLSKGAFSALKQFDTADITFMYCTEFIVQRDMSKSYDEDETREFLSTIGDSLVAVSDEDYIKIHVHTDHPGLALEHGLRFGQLTNIKIENMCEQHSSILDEGESAVPAKPKKDLGFVSIVAGSGFVEILKSLEVDEIVEGGQTMNPSTEDIIEAITRVHANNVIVMPNNKNIILAAEQAAELVKDCNVSVVPTKTIPEGISAMICVDKSSPVDDITNDMKDVIKGVQTGLITIAVRDTVMKGQNIVEGEYLGILDGEIVTHQPTIKEAYSDLLSKLNDDSEIVSIYYGEDIDANTADEYFDMALEMYNDIDVELHCGNQPVYYFMISAE